MSLFMLSRLVIVFLPRSKCLLISWLQSPSAVIFGAKEKKSVTVFIFSQSSCHEVMVLGFSDSSVGKESALYAGDAGLIPGWGRSVGKGIGYPFQDSWASLVAQW